MFKAPNKIYFELIIVGEQDKREKKGGEREGGRVCEHCFKCFRSFSFPLARLRLSIKNCIVIIEGEWTLLSNKGLRIRNFEFLTFSFKEISHHFSIIIVHSFCSDRVLLL